jgi:hypothetical protein
MPASVISRRFGHARPKYPGVAIVNIDNETGLTTPYSAISGKATVTQGAALNGSVYGLNILIDDTTVDYASKTGLNSTTGKLRMRVYFDLNTITMANTNNFYVFSCYDSGVNSLVTGFLNWETTAKYQMKFYYKTDAALTAGTLINVTDAPHCLEFLYTKAATNVSSDGTFYSWIDGVPLDTLTGKDIYDNFPQFNQVRLGDTTAPPAGVAGNLFYDDLVINNTGDPIGP